MMFRCERYNGNRLMETTYMQAKDIQECRNMLKWWFFNLNMWVIRAI